MVDGQPRLAHTAPIFKKLTHYRPASQKWTVTLEGSTVVWFHPRGSVTPPDGLERFANDNDLGVGG